jgi:hypothetical protein
MLLQTRPQELALRLEKFLALLLALLLVRLQELVPRLAKLLEPLRLGQPQSCPA